MSDQEPLKITLEDLGLEETPAVSEQRQSKLREGAEQVSHKVAGAVKDTTGKVTARVAETTADVANRSAEAVREKVSETIQAQTKATADAVEQRIREIDWKAEAQKGAEESLRWLGRRFEALAERLQNEEKKPDDKPS
jgi:hypothetical protein